MGVLLTAAAIVASVTIGVWAERRRPAAAARAARRVLVLLLYVLLRFTAWVNGWAHSFTRLFTVVRSGLWQRWDLPSLLQLYGTADGSFRCLGQPEQAFLSYLL